MKDLNHQFDTFGQLLEENLFIDPSVTFTRICHAIGAEPEALDRFLADELGYTGDEVLREYRRQYRGRLAEKYGIRL